MPGVPEPLNDDVVAALSRFFGAGEGPRHVDLDSVFDRTGCRDFDPGGYSEGVNKEIRVKTALGRAHGDPRAGRLVEALLSEMRAFGTFALATDDEQRTRVDAAHRAFETVGYRLSADGQIEYTGHLDLATGGRPALDEQIRRLKRSADDPALMIGTAKDLLESVSKHVLAELDSPARDRADFSEVWYLSRDRLGIRPEQVADGSPAAPQIRKILGAGTTIGEQVNELRNLQGTGHGRTLPTGITVEIALLVVREAVSVAEFLLTTLDRHLGRR